MTEERLQTWLGFAKFLLGTFALGLVTTLINNAIQKREVELKEQEQVGQFLQHALHEDVGVRRRFAQYFSTVTRSDELRKGWTAYYGVVEQEYEEARAEKEKLEAKAAKQDLGAQEREHLNIRIAELERALSPSSSAAQIAITPRVYFQIREEEQRPAAKAVAEVLSENAIIVPGIQRLSSGPSGTELRYFRAKEKDEAEAIGSLLRDLDVEVVVRYVPGYELSTAIRPRHYELWFSDQPISTPTDG